jgi:hypothetical protein
MNDTELDELLNTWSAPPPPASLRERVRAGFAAGLEREASLRVPSRWIWAFARKSLLAGAILGTGALFLLAVTQAFPQTPPGRIPYIVHSEYVRYAEDGSSAVEMYLTSYNNDQENEILLSRSLPGNPLGTALARTLDAALPAWQRLTRLLTVSDKELETIRAIRAARPGVGFISGCAGGCSVLHRWGFARAAAGANAGCLAGPIVGSETILNYPTTAVELHLDDSRRMTVWTAPDLECFALRITTERQKPDGTYSLVTRKQALRVTVNP